MIDGDDRKIMNKRVKIMTAAAAIVVGVVAAIFMS